MNNKLETHTVVNLKEYQKLNKQFNYKFKERFLICIIIITSIFLFGLIPPDAISISDFLQVELVFVLLAFIILKILNIFIEIKEYKTMLNYYYDSIEYTVIFKDESLVRISDNQNYEIKYSNIKLIKQTVNNFYFLINKNIIITIIKDNCSEELCIFIKDLNRKININNKNYCNQNQEKYNREIKKKLFKNCLILLFILLYILYWIGLFYCFVNLFGYK